jgi:hypothetical protein
MVRIEKDDDLRRIVEALLNELSARKVLEYSTVQNIADEGKGSQLVTS